MLDSTAISALSVLGGSLVGALTSLASTWLTGEHQARRELLGKHMAARESLYASFISEASKVVVDSLVNNRRHIDSLIPLYSLFGRIRLNASDAVIQAADDVISGIIAEYLQPKPAVSKTTELSLDPERRWWADSLTAFSQVCRDELLTPTDDGQALSDRQRQAIPDEPP